MHASVLVVELHLPLPGSRKEKRAVITPIIEGARRRHRVAASETAHQDQLRRAQLAFATVASTEHVARESLDAVERFVWSFPEVEVLDAWRRWFDDQEEQP